MKRSTLIQIIFFGLAIVFVVIVVVTAVKTAKFKSTAMATIGTVTSIRESYSDDSESYYPTVEYFVGEESFEYESNVGASEGTYEIDQELELLYAIRDDGIHKVKLQGVWQLWAGTLVTAILAFATGFVGLLLRLSGRQQRKKQDRLRAAGLHLELSIVRISEQNMTRGTDASTINMMAYAIIVEWTDANGKVWQFKSGNARRHFSEFGKDVGDTVDVYLNPVHPKQYFIDLDFVPGKYLY